MTPLLEVRALSKTFPVDGLFSRARRSVLEDVSFTIDRGEAVALVGESGSGKSTVARILLRLLEADGGEVRLEGRDVLAEEPRRPSTEYRRKVQMIFQDPFASLNPVHTILHHVVRPLANTGEKATSAERRKKALELLASVGLEPAEEFGGKHPDALSGGQRQRVAIARALAMNPALVIADEPTSMLDVSIRMGVLNLLARLKRERGLSLLLITHDLASARYLADRVLVLQKGRIVEEGATEALIGDPKHPYTQALLRAAPGARSTPEGTIDA